ncbi:hypothetical protein VTO42DRAFT_5608 [Malbranchea cinnamomea]
MQLEASHISFACPIQLSGSSTRSRAAESMASRIHCAVLFFIISSVALGMALTCDDTTGGRWSERHLILGQGQAQANYADAERRKGFFGSHT